MKPNLSKSKRCSAVPSAMVVSGMSLYAAAQSVLPRPDPDFNGKLGQTVATSTPDFPRQVVAPKGAPSVLMMLTDDVGHSAASSFGGPIATPTFEALAENGLRCNQFQPTAMCSPSRSALITGRNHHRNTNDLAANNPTKLKELQAAFDVEARKYNVYPLQTSVATRADVTLRPKLTLRRDSLVDYPGAVRISKRTAPDSKNRSFSVIADVVIRKGSAAGVLATQGGNFGGSGLYVDAGKPAFAYAHSNQPQHK